MSIKKTIKIKFLNGLDFETGIRDILNIVTNYYEFVDSSEPDFIIFGPYGNNIPPQGNYVRIGYYCENFVPDISICDWAFGIPYEDEVKHPKYMRIQWHGFEPSLLVKKNIDIEKIIPQKTKFCNFVYSNKVPFREFFFKSLSKYKHIDAPGKSMNNMPSIDNNQEGDIWARKRKFLSEYKFTIAFENYSYPGYNTEKLLDPMTVNSLPIYCGNIHIDRQFNTKSFVNSHEYLTINNSPMIKFLEATCQPSFKDILPGTYAEFGDKAKRKIKSIGRKIKTNLQFSNFDSLIERIIEIDKDDSLYASYLLEPWFYDNTYPSNEAIVNRWQEIFG